jgi:hypothetical protein
LRFSVATEIKHNECPAFRRHPKTTDDGDVYYVSLKRSYKDGNDWKDVLVWLGANEVLAAGRVLTRSFDAIDELYSQRGSSFVDTAKREFDATDSGSPDDDIPF